MDHVASSLTTRSAVPAAAALIAKGRGRHVGRIAYAPLVARARE